MGFWTLRKGPIALQPEIGQRMVDAAPTFTHMALADLLNAHILQTVITLNVDGWVLPLIAAHCWLRA